MCICLDIRISCLCFVSVVVYCLSVCCAVCWLCLVYLVAVGNRCCLLAAG